MNRPPRTITSKPFGVGLIGVSAQRGWGNAAHIPALRALSCDFELVGVANTNLASSRAAAAALDFPRAFDSAGELVTSPDIDVVVITVKVPQHRELVMQAVDAGKSIYCEWPLGTGPAEARELSQLANESKALGVVGTQAIASPEVEYIRKLVADGYVGDVLSSTYIGVGPTWGSDVALGDVYALDSKNGATLLSVIGGHAISAIESVLGRIEEVGAVLSQRRRRLRVIETGEMTPLKTPDQVLANAVLQSGAPLSLHLRGGLPGGTSLLWEINGSAGDLRITAKAEQIPVINISPLRVEGGRRGDVFREIDIPSSFCFGLEDSVAARNVACVYRMLANDLRHGTRTAPSFDDAVALHKTLYAIEQSAAAGKRVRVM